MTRVSLSIVPLLALGFASQLFAEVKSFTIPKLEEIDINLPAGKVLVVSTDQKSIDVGYEQIRWSNRCKLKISETETKLSVSVSNQKRCKVNFSIKIPIGTNINLAQGSGKATLDLKGALFYETKSASMFATGEISLIEGSSGSGDINLSGVVGNCQIKSASGDLLLTFSKVPQDGSCSLESGSGDIAIFVPKGAKLQPQLTSRARRLRSELTKNPESSYSLSASTGAGRITAEYLEDQSK